MTTSQLPRLPLQIKYKSNTTTFSLLMSAILLKNARKVKKRKKKRYTILQTSVGRETGNSFTGNVQEPQNEEMQFRNCE